jgi:hypothetical protein
VAFFAGEMWLKAMNDAARDLNISLQFCMMNGCDYCELHNN